MYDFSFLRQLRKRDDLTIGDVSARSGISAAVISKLERNQTRAELETLFKLSRVFGLTTNELVALASDLCQIVVREFAPLLLDRTLHLLPLSCELIPIHNMNTFSILDLPVLPGA